MDNNFYLEKFQSAFAKIDKTGFDNVNIKLFVGHAMNSVVMKAYKPEWSGSPQDPLTADSRIFFSVWLNEKAILENKLYYNIHAFKLRALKGYKISSRDFAKKFRNQFMKQHRDWPNVSVEYGPLTLMQGWEQLNVASVQKDIAALVRRFLTVSPIIDAVLSNCKIQE